MIEDRVGRVPWIGRYWNFIPGGGSCKSFTWYVYGGWINPTPPLIPPSTHPMYKSWALLDLWKWGGRWMVLKGNLIHIFPLVVFINKLLFKFGNYYAI